LQNIASFVRMLSAIRLIWLVKFYENLEAQGLVYENIEL